MISLMTLRLQQDILDSQEQCSRERANANRYKFLVYEGNHTFWPVPFNLCEEFLNSHIVKFVKNPHPEHNCGGFNPHSPKTGTRPPIARPSAVRPPGTRPPEPRPPGAHDHRHGVSHNTGNQFGNRLNPENMKYHPNFNQTPNFLSPNVSRPVSPQNEPSTFRRRMSLSFDKHRKNLEKKKTLFSITFCNLGKEAEAARHSECFSTGCSSQVQVMEKELLLSMRLVITHLLDQPKIAYYLIESNIQRGWLIDGCVDIEGNHADSVDPCCESTDNGRRGSGFGSFTKSPAKSPGKSPRGFKQALGRRNSRVNIPERRLSWKANKKNGDLGLNGVTVCIRPMEIDNLFTILARLSKLTKDDELMCTLEDFFDSYGETVLHKQFGNHHYATPLHIICQYHNINLLERCVNRLKNCPFDQDGNHPFHYIGKMKKERLNPEIMKRLAMYAVAFNCSQFLTKIQCTTR